MELRNLASSIPGFPTNKPIYDLDNLISNISRITRARRIVKTAKHED